MLEDLGSILLECCDESNIPVGCDLYETDDGRWQFAADNYMPRRCYVALGQYLVTADSKDELVAMVHKHVVPLYRNALASISKGSLYYWDGT